MTGAEIREFNNYLIYQGHRIGYVWAWSSEVDDTYVNLGLSVHDNYDKIYQRMIQHKMVHELSFNWNQFMMHVVLAEKYLMDVEIQYQPWTIISPAAGGQVAAYFSSQDDALNFKLLSGCGEYRKLSLVGDEYLDS